MGWARVQHELPFKPLHKTRMLVPRPRNCKAVFKADAQAQGLMSQQAAAVRNFGYTAHLVHLLHLHLLLQRCIASCSSKASVVASLLLHCLLLHEHALLHQLLLLLLLLRHGWVHLGCSLGLVHPLHRAGQVIRMAWSAGQARTPGHLRPSKLRAARGNCSARRRDIHMLTCCACCAFCGCCAWRCCV